MARRRSSEDTTLLSFLDTLSNGVGAAILLLLVFGAAELSSRGGLPDAPAQLVRVQLFNSEPNASLWAMVTRPSGKDVIRLQVPGNKEPSTPVVGMMAYPTRDDAVVLQIPITPGDCAEITLGYINHQQLTGTALGALQELPIRAEWEPFGRCCFSAKPSYADGPLQLTVAPDGRVKRCNSKKPASCACPVDQ